MEPEGLEEQEEEEYDERPEQEEGEEQVETFGPYESHHEQAAVRVQAALRALAVRRRLVRFRARRSVLAELALTENKYLVSLRISTADYLHPLIQRCSTNDEVVPADKLKLIFGNIEIVEMLSKKMLVEFTKRSVRCNYYTRIGEVFLSLQSSLTCYADYVKHYDAARKALGELMESTSRLREFDLSVQKKHNTRLGLRDFLIMPVQRIPRYILLLRDILKQTDKALPDYADVQSAMAMLEEFTTHMDLEAQRAEALRIIESKLTGDLTLLQSGNTSDRRFLHEGPVFDEGRGKRVYLFLFSDVVVVAKEPDQQSGSKITLRRAPKDDGRMLVIGAVPLTELSRCTNMKGDDASPSFKLDGAMYRCQSEEERQIWINHIHRILRDLRARATKRMTLSMGSQKTITVGSQKLRRQSAHVTEQDRAKARWSAEYDGLLGGAGGNGAAARTSAGGGSLTPEFRSRSSSSGFQLGTGRLKRSASTAGPAAAGGVVVTANPLMTLRATAGPRSRSRSTLAASSISSSGSELLASATATTSTGAALATGDNNSKSESGQEDGNVTAGKSLSRTEGAVTIDPSMLPPPPVLPPPSTLLQNGPEEDARAKYDFNGSNTKELTISVGMVGRVVRKLQSGWTLLRMDDGRVGMVPTSYLEFQAVVVPPNPEEGDNSASPFSTPPPLKFN